MKSIVEPRAETMEDLQRARRAVIAIERSVAPLPAPAGRPKDGTFLDEKPFLVVCPVQAVKVVEHPIVRGICRQLEENPGVVEAAPARRAEELALKQGQPRERQGPLLAFKGA